MIPAHRPFRGGQRYRVTAGRRIHILDGDASGGGHRFGAGKGKSEFPQHWTDDQIISAIENVANDPQSVSSSGRGGRKVIRGVENGLLILVVVDPADGSIVTGYPT